MDPKELKDARINDVFVESDSRILLHLKDGRAVAIEAASPTDKLDTRLRCGVVNPGGQR